MPFDISLTAGMRADLTSLQGTSVLLNRTQQRLSTGKQVNAAVDNPAAYFAAQEHTNHASDLSSRKSDMGEAIQSVNAANAGISSITTLISQAQALLTTAQSANKTTRASLAGQFNTILNQITQVAGDSGYNGNNFLHGGSLKVLFNETGSSSLTVTGFSGDAAGLGVTTAAIGTGTVAVAYTAEALGNAVVNNTKATLTHSGVIKSASVTVTQSITGVTGSSWIGTNASAKAVSGKSVALGHVGIASNVVVYEKLQVQSGALAAGSAATGASAALAAQALGSVTVVKHAYANLTASTWINTNASAKALTAKAVSLGHIGIVSNVVVFEKLQITSGVLAGGAATAGASATLAFAPVGTIVVKTQTGATLTQGTNYTAYVVSGVTHVAMITVATAGINVIYSYDKNLTLTTDYTVSTGGLATAAKITFTKGFNAASAIGVNYSVVSKTATTLTQGTNYTAYVAGGKTHIAMITTATGGIAVTYDYGKNLSAGTYTVSTGGLATAATVTFSKKYTTASGIGVTYDVQSKVSAAKYTLGLGGNSTAGSVTFKATVTGTVQANYSAAVGGLWESDAALQKDTTNLNNAITMLRTQASTMAANLSVITTRQTWSQSMISNYQIGADNLTLADMNEEGANMLALQTRQQLGIQALSLASQANQSVMRLFG